MKLATAVIASVLVTSTLSHADGDKDKQAKKPHAGFNISIHDNQVDIDGLGDYIDDQIDAALDQLDDSNVPPAMRAKLKEHLKAMRAKLAKKLAHLDAKDLDQLGEELGKMGEEMGKEMEQEFGKDFGKDFGKKWSHAMHGMHGMHVGPSQADSDDDDDFDTDVGDSPDVDDDDDLDDAVKDLGDLHLQPAQREQIQKLRTDSDQKVAAAKKALATASKTLHDQLDNPATSDADLAKSIDAVAQQEAAIRKARILAWHAARRVLDDAQRKKVEDAAAKGKSK